MVLNVNLIRAENFIKGCYFSWKHMKAREPLPAVIF